MSDVDLEALEEVARAATPGPWIAYADRCVRSPDRSILYDDSCQDRENADADMAYVETFDPPTVLALIERGRGAEAEREDALDRYAEREQRWHWNLIREQNAVHRAEVAEAKVAQVEALARAWEHGPFGMVAYDIASISIRAALASETAP